MALRLCLLLLLAGCPRPGLVVSAPSTAPLTSSVGPELPEGPQPPKPPMDDEYMMAALQVRRADVAGALAAIATFEKDYPTSPYLGNLLDWKDNLATFGKPAPPLTVTRWVNQAATLADHPVTLVVFFEPWCPHCQDEVPALQGLADAYSTRGLGVIAVTAMTRGATEEMLGQFIALGGIRFPVAVEDGSMSEAWGVVGVPHLVFVRDGTVVWAGNAALITIDLVDAIVDRAPLPLPMPDDAPPTP